QLQGARHRDISRVVDVEAEELPLGGHDSDHPEAGPSDAHELPERVGLAEQLALDLGAQHGELRRPAGVSGRPEGALAHVEFPGVIWIMLVPNWVNRPIM